MRYNLEGRMEGISMGCVCGIGKEGQWSVGVCLDIFLLESSLNDIDVVSHPFYVDALLLFLLCVMLLLEKSALGSLC